MDHKEKDDFLILVSKLAHTLEEKILEAIDNNSPNVEILLDKLLNVGDSEKDFIKALIMWKFLTRSEVRAFLPDNAKKDLTDIPIASLMLKYEQAELQEMADETDDPDLKEAIIDRMPGRKKPEEPPSQKKRWW